MPSGCPCGCSNGSSLRSSPGFLVLAHAPVGQLSDTHLERFVLFVALPSLDLFDDLVNSLLESQSQLNFFFVDEMFHFHLLSCLRGPHRRIERQVLQLPDLFRQARVALAQLLGVLVQRGERCAGSGVRVFESLVGRLQARALAAQGRVRLSELENFVPQVLEHLFALVHQVVR